MEGRIEGCEGGRKGLGGDGISRDVQEDREDVVHSVCCDLGEALERGQRQDGRQQCNHQEVRKSR